MIYEFTPTQDLHGYDEPWAPGGHNNLLNPEDYEGDKKTIFGVKFTRQSDGSINAVGKATGGTAFYNVTVGSAYHVDATTYSMRFTMKGTKTGGKAFLTLSGGDLGTGVPYTRAEIDSGTTGTNTFTPTDAGNLFYVMIQIPEGVEVNCVFYPQIEKGSTSHDWTPYANICPISGYNIWDPSNNEWVQVYSGDVDANANKLYLHPVYEEYDGEELVGPWMSSMDKYTEEGTPTTGAFVVDFGGEVTEYDITDFMLQTLLDSIGVRRFITSGAMLLNSLMDQAQGRVRSEAELLNRSFPIHVIAIGKELPTNLVIKKPVSDVLPGLPGKFIR